MSFNLLEATLCSTVSLFNLYQPRSRPSDWGEEGGGEKAWYTMHVHALHFSI